MLVAAEIDMSVLLDCHFCVSFHLVWRGRQWTQFRLLYRMEVFLSCIGALLHAGLIMACKIFGYSGVQLFQREELPVAESGVYPVIYYLHLVLYLRFMSISGKPRASYSGEVYRVRGKLVHFPSSSRTMPLAC